MKFYIGDRIKIRSWDDMVKEFGTDKDGDIEVKTGKMWFPTVMEHLCGREATITKVVEICHNHVEYELKNWSDNTGDVYIWKFTGEMLELVKEEK